MRRLIIAAVAVAVLGLGVVAVGGAATSAQEGDGPIGTFLGKLADRLGMSEDDLTAAIRDVRTEMIDEAVADGRLTEEQGERLKERLEEGGALFPRPPKDERPRPRPEVCQRAVRFVVDAAARVLDVPKDDLVAELKDGKSLAQVAEAKGMGIDEFTGALLDQVRAQFDELVADDKLTEEQAERLFARFEENVDRVVNAAPETDRPCRPRPGPRGFDRPLDRPPVDGASDFVPPDLTS